MNIQLLYRLGILFMISDSRMFRKIKKWSQAKSVYNKIKRQLKNDIQFYYLIPFLIIFLCIPGNTDLHVRFWYEHVNGPDGKVHWNITKHDIKYDVEKAFFRLENLLNDKTIGKFTAESISMAVENSGLMMKMMKIHHPTYLVLKSKSYLLLLAGYT